MKLANKKLTEQEFLEQRLEVLKTWPTGNDPDLNLDKAVEYLRNVPQEKNFAIVLNKAKAANDTLIQPRGGVPVLADPHGSMIRQQICIIFTCFPKNSRISTGKIQNSDRKSMT